MKPKGDRSETMPRTVRIAASFEQSFEEMATYYEAMRVLFPDAGARLRSFNHELFERVIPLLERHPDIGRLYPLRRVQDTTEDRLLANLVPALARKQATVREFIERDFSILYLVTADLILLLDLKHHRQSRY